MDQPAEFQELGFIGDEAEVTPRIRALRVLARVIARELINSRHVGKDDNSTTTDHLRDRLTHDEVSEGQRPLRIHNKTRSRNCLDEA